MSIANVAKELTHELLDAKAESDGLQWKCNQLEFEPDKLQDENAELRELVLAMEPFLCCMPFAGCNTLAQNVRKRMRGLGFYE